METFALTGPLRILLYLLAATGVVYFMGTRLRNRLGVVQYGVIGLAVARALARTGRDVLVLEKNEVFGRITTVRIRKYRFEIFFDF